MKLQKIKINLPPGYADWLLRQENPNKVLLEALIDFRKKIVNHLKEKGEKR